MGVAPAAHFAARRAAQVMATNRPSLADVRALDAADPLRDFRARFDLPEGVIYLDGNSLGPLPSATPQRIADAVTVQWGRGLVTSWNEHDWIGAPQRVGDKIASLIGARAGEVVVADSTSVNLYKLILAAARLNPQGTELVTEAGNFPSDIYIAEGAAQTLGLTLRVAECEALLDTITPQTAAVALTQVNYRSGYRHDIAALTRHAASMGVPIIWDLSHSIGAVPLDLGVDGAELAVGCGYKHLNGGPGAPAFLYVAKHLQEQIASPICGWLGHAAPFDFAGAYRPAPGIGKFLAGTPPMLSLLALEGGVDLMLEVDMQALFAKSAALFDLFATLVTAQCPELLLASPQDPARRSGHIAFAHGGAYAIIQALIARGVIGDFRTPDIARFGLTPLYTSFDDVYRAVAILNDVMSSGAWQRPEFSTRRLVT